MVRQSFDKFPVSSVNRLDKPFPKPIRKIFVGQDGDVSMFGPTISNVSIPEMSDEC